MSMPGKATAGETLLGRSEEELEALRVERWRRTESLRGEFAHELDLAYGDHPRQRVDLYLPHGKPAGPLLVFLHGGGFRGGDHASVGYHGRPYLERGAVFASLSYRVLPETKFPDMCDDVEEGLNWLADRLEHLGGDRRRIYLSGHSAGAALAAMVTMRPLRQREPGLVKGLVGISGMYDFTRLRPEETNRSSAHHVARLAESITRLPEHTIIVYGDRDLPFVAPDARALVAAVRARGGSVELVVEADADHFEANRGFVGPQGTVALAVNRMLGLAEP